MDDLTRFAACLLILVSVAGCSHIPLTEGGIAVDKNTTVGIEDLGVASVTRGF